MLDILTAQVSHIQMSRKMGVFGAGNLEPNASAQGRSGKQANKKKSKIWAGSGSSEQNMPYDVAIFSSASANPIACYLTATGHIHGNGKLIPGLGHLLISKWLSNRITG